MGDPIEQEVQREVEQEVPQESSGKSKRSNWLWPAGAVATGLAGAALLLLRGCWHRRMSWPVRAEGQSYQVCLGCGVKRLFDEQNFRSYGPFHNDLNELIAWERSRRTDSVAIPEVEPLEAEPDERRRPAS
ncbi:MAG TPA: hypothetical protein VNW47_10810 [Terriglobales bacterium]|nr:hypothetical protein [Terriglobales bacterium]